MIKLKKVCIMLFCCLFVVTGCLDRRELNDIAIILGWGMDQKDDGTYVASAQIVVPSKLGNSTGGAGASPGEGYLFETAKGKSATDAAQNMQLKLSRELFASHRRVILLGENIAKNGLAKIIDEYSRNPEVRLRTDIFVVKGGTARELLSIPYKLESMSALAPIKIHQSVGGTESITFKQFLSETISEGSNATLPTIEVVSSGGNNGQAQQGKTFKITGRAIFDKDLKMIGTLNAAQARDRFWIRNELKVNTLTVKVPKGNGNISFTGRKFKSKVKPVIQGGKVKFFISLFGKGTIKENNTNLDLKSPKNLKAIEQALNKNIKNHMTGTISHIQEEYQADILGLGETVHRKYPKRWKKLKGNWNEEFAQAEIIIKVDMNVEQVGTTGPSIHLKESEIKK
jgi:spore germination protein KC